MDADEMDLGEAKNLIHAGKIAEGRPAGIRAGDGCCDGAKDCHARHPPPSHHPLTAQVNKARNQPVRA